MKKRINKGKKVFIGLSGGVDSSVAAYLLKQQGYAVTGVFMKCYNIDGCAVKDAKDAKKAADHLDIPFYTFDFEEEYKKRVVEYMIDGYKKGITPNPDIMCNKEIKFDLFLKEALNMGADYIATGHYARKTTNTPSLAWARLRELFRIPRRETKTWPSGPERAPEEVYGRALLYQGKDKQKDQTYFLWTLTQDQLKHCLFPIGKYKKEKVRRIAKKVGLPTWNKKDSQGICFLGKVRIEDFLKQYIAPKPGAIKDEEGKVIGKHNGAAYYTIGQRHGLNLSTSEKPNTRPHYVTKKDLETNTITVAEGKENPALTKKKLTLTSTNFLSPSTYSPIRANKRIEVLARIRHRQPLQKATLRKDNVTSSQDVTLKLIFKKPQKFVAPGQSAVIYSKKGQLLGGGVIKDAI